MGGRAAGGGMQFIESSIIGLRSAVTTLRHRTTPLRFILFPMVHVAEQQFYDDVAARARLCQLIVAEGIPSKFAPAQEWMAQRQRWDRLVDQVAGLRLQSLGVPVRWEAKLDDQPKSRREQLKSRVIDIADRHAERRDWRAERRAERRSRRGGPGYSFDQARATCRLLAQSVFC
jgi:hypothetical protein